MEVLLWMLELAWRIALFILGWQVIKWVISAKKDGTFHDVLDTIGLAIKAGCVKLRRWLIRELSKEETKSAEESTNGTVD